MKKYIKPTSFMVESALSQVIAASLPIVEETVDGSLAQSKLDEWDDEDF